MCRAARARLRKAGLGRTVRIRRGSALDASRILSRAERARVDVVHAASLLNALCRNRSTLERGIARLRAAFPGRTLLVVDYLGVLSYEHPAPRRRRHTALQDLVQALSGQGVPPPSHDAWSLSYAAAGARLVEVMERRGADLRWFVHVVQL